MQGSKKIPIIDLNTHITCKICNGYFVDATTIIECLHTFCRSCIVRYLENNRYCPVCDVQVHKTKPLLNIRPDKTLQDIVYKLVPRLFQNEMQRRRDFYENHPEAKPSSLEQCGEASYQHLLTPEETVCLMLSYHGCSSLPRYLRCPAAVSVGHLKKLIRAKYDLSTNHRVEILYNQDCLSSSLTLMDVAYIYLWKRKGPIELTYRIYECTAKKPKLEPQSVETTETTQITATTTSTATNNNNWKEVQLRISENGEMSITGIQDSALSPSLLEIVNSDQKYKNEVLTVVESKSGSKNTGGNTPRKELPGLKFIGKSTTVLTSNTASISVSTTKKSSELTVPCSIVPVSIVKSLEAPLPEKTSGFEIQPTTFLTSCATLSSATTTTVFSTINDSKCSTKTDDTPLKVDEPPSKSQIHGDVADKEGAKNLFPKLPPTVNNLKRKTDSIPEAEPPNKQPKPTILNHSIGLLNLSNNHPLKKHSKLNRNGESIKDVAKSTASSPETMTTVTTTISKLVTTTTTTKTTTTTSDVTFSKPCFVNKNLANVQASRPGTPIMTTKPSIISSKPSIIPPKPAAPVFSGLKSPCYMPKTSYNPVITVPKPMTSCSGVKVDTRPQNALKSEVKAPTTSVAAIKTMASASSFTVPKLDSKPAAAPSQPQQTANANNKMGIKSKPSTPIGYKTLRDPPKSWNSQISKANLNKPSPDPKYSDLKNVRPAKFFKMRNNMPRYLGNPASGVKPMYQVHVSPEKEKLPEGNKIEKSEIRKHSIVKIDPKTLKPISERAPDTTSLSNHSSSNQALSNQSLSNHTGQNYNNQSLVAQGLSSNISLASQNDLKINTSSVSIFNPLKLQSSPKNERKSPKSPHSPKLKAQATNSPTGSKRDKVNLNFTPPNPFIPNLTSPTISPNQFLYPTGPPGFPPYDPRMMAAYHSLWYGQRMAFPTSPIPGLSLDLNQRKNFEMMASPTSQQGHSPQISTKLASTTSSNISSVSRPQNILPSAPKQSVLSKKTLKESKNEKRLETTVEKLTQSRNREISSKSEPPSGIKNAEKDVERGKKPEAAEPGKGKEKNGRVETRVGPEGKENLDGCTPSASTVKTPCANASPDKSRVENDGQSPCEGQPSSECSETTVSQNVRVGVSTDSNDSIRESPCTDRDKEEISGSNTVKSRNVNNSSNKDNKPSGEVVAKDK